VPYGDYTSSSIAETSTGSLTDEDADNRAVLFLCIGF
jgi:hypothetical protein